MNVQEHEALARLEINQFSDWCLRATEVEPHMLRFILNRSINQFGIPEEDLAREIGVEIATIRSWRELKTSASQPQEVAQALGRVLLTR